MDFLLFISFICRRNANWECDTNTQMNSCILWYSKLYKYIERLHSDKIFYFFLLSIIFYWKLFVFFLSSVLFCLWSKQIFYWQEASNDSFIFFNSICYYAKRKWKWKIFLFDSFNLKCSNKKMILFSFIHRSDMCVVWTHAFTLFLPIFSPVDITSNAINFIVKQKHSNDCVLKALDNLITIMHKYQAFLHLQSTEYGMENIRFDWECLFNPFNLMCVVCICVPK